MSQEQLQRKKYRKLLKMALSADYWEEQSLLPEELELWP